MTHDELVEEVAALKSALFTTGDLAQTLAAELTNTRNQLTFVLESLQGTQYGQEAVIHALMAPVLRSDELSGKQFAIMLDGCVNMRRDDLPADSLGNFDTTIESARKMVDVLAS